MRVYQEMSLFNDFEFWGGAKEFAARLTEDEMEAIEAAIEECFPEGISETSVNDLFWFDDDWLLEILGIDYDDFWGREAFI